MSLSPIQCLWIGDELSLLEQLSIASFIKQGHQLILWSYNPIAFVPKEVEIRDADQLIPKNKIFRTTKSHAGSPAFFADIFRFKMLYEHGGWWSDLDNICLKPLDFSLPYVFRKHRLGASLNIIKAPPKKEVMIKTYQQIKNKVNKSTEDWNLPTRIFSKNIKKYKLEEFIKPHYIFDRDAISVDLFKGEREVENRYLLHFSRILLKLERLDPNSPKKETFYYKLLKEHNII